MKSHLSKAHRIKEKLPRSKLNEEIADYFSLFSKDPIKRTTALVQNPYGKTKNIEEIKQKAGLQISALIELLNEFYDLNIEKIDFSKQAVEKMAILFLINQKFLLNTKDGSPKIKKILTKKRILFASNILQKIHYSELWQDLQDKFFAFLHPKTYAKYFSIFSLTQEKGQHGGLIVRKDLDSLLKNFSINADIKTRIKSIHSVYKKMKIRNILLSQVLDAIGLRVIVENKDACYKVFGLILEKWPILNNKIKDFIAFPKNNGYQSIHVTVMHDGLPVEIQIRSKHMHYHAQYGLAAHERYKT